MELKEGMYVMTTDRMKIGQIKGFCTCEMCEKRGFYEPVIDADICITDYDKSRGFHGYKFYDNPIDLIELGDYVNGLIVTRICVDEETEKKYLNLYGSLSEWENEDIESIVTKEMFESVKYEVE